MNDPINSYGYMCNQTRNFSMYTLNIKYSILYIQKGSTVSVCLNLHHCGPHFHLCKAFNIYNIYVGARVTRCYEYPYAKYINILNLGIFMIKNVHLITDFNDPATEGHLSEIWCHTKNIADVDYGTKILFHFEETEI